MKKLQKIVAMVMCVFSTFTIFPTINYADYYTKDASSLISKAWYKTGSNLKKAMEKVITESEEAAKQKI